MTKRSGGAAPPAPMLAQLGVLVAIAGCGRVGFDPRGLPGDAAAVDTPATCTLGPFTAPTRLAGPIQSLSDDWFPTPARDETVLFFSSFRPPSLGSDLWFATRADRSAAFEAPIRIAELATTGSDAHPTVSEDGLELIFVSNGPGGDSDLWRATRDAPTATWAPPVLIAELSSGAPDFHPFLSADQRRLVFSSSRPGTQGRLDLYEAVRPAPGLAFEAPRLLVELNSADDDSAPTLSADNRDIYFASTRPGGVGGLDVYTARRVAEDQPFSPPQPVAAVQTPFDEVGLRLSLDGRTLYLNHDTALAGGRDADLWTSTRTCE